VETKGLTFEQFLNGITIAQREGFEGRFLNAKIPHELINEIKEKPGFNIYAFSEPWCSDCVYNLPVVAKLAQECGNISLRILNRDVYINEVVEFNIEKIPTFIIFDTNWNYIDRWIERPLVVKETLKEQDEEKITTLKIKYAKGEFAQDVLKEIVEILKRG
jgi:thiol-disulfide isomerase/thioredoxin